MMRIKIILKKELVLQRLGFMKGRGFLTPEVEELIDRAMSEAPAHIEERFKIKKFDVLNRGSDKIIFKGGYGIKSRSIASLLKDCARAYIFAATIGDGLGHRATECLSSGSATEAMVYDAIGSVAVESLAELLNKRIKEEENRLGFGMTRRFSPGYGDWGLDAQPGLLKELGAEGIGITVTPLNQMLPEKSVTAICGAYRNE